MHRYIGVLLFRYDDILLAFDWIDNPDFQVDEVEPIMVRALIISYYLASFT